MISLNKTGRSSKFQLAKEKVLNSPTILEQMLTAAHLHDIMEEYGVEFRNRVFTPTSTIWTFLTQVMSADGSCRAAVVQFFSSLKIGSCSLANSAYCQARKRLDKEVLRKLVISQADKLQGSVEKKWLWKARQVRLVDGTTVSMPDSKDNQLHFPATNKKRNPAEFPIARIVVVLCKTTGVLLNAAIGSYQGKGSGETSLLKQLLSSFSPGDVTIFDRFYAGFFSMAGLMNKQVDVVTRQHQRRKVEPIKRLGKNDCLFEIKKPKCPADLSQEEYENYPDIIILRRVKVCISKRGFRTTNIEVITSLTDQKYTAEDIAELYRSRWFVEVDIRSIKSDLGMEVLRCQSAEMVCKEIWVHFLAYNLIRAVMMDTARTHGLDPRGISFKACLQIIFTYRAQMVLVSSSKWIDIYLKILNLLKTQIIGTRPNRFEPRLYKRRSNKKYLNEDRQLARERILNRAA